MKIKYLILLLILVISFSGCKDDVVPEIQTKYKYIYKPIPKIEDKPKFNPYNMIMVNFNGQEYYAIPKIDGLILKNNWELYKIWAISNYEILKSLENNITGELYE